MDYPNSISFPYVKTPKLCNPHEQGNIRILGVNEICISDRIYVKLFSLILS